MLRENLSVRAEGAGGAHRPSLRDSIFGRTSEAPALERPPPTLFDVVHDLVELSEDAVERLEQLYDMDATLAERLLPQICTVYLYGSFAERNRLPMRDQIFQFL
eukprot:COSAG02_NODE_20104_length_848_cov_1.224299_2_plen_103_part_01